MYEEVNTSLVDDEDEEITGEIPPYSSMVDMLDREDLFGNVHQQPVSYHISISHYPFLLFFLLYALFKLFFL